MGNFCSKKQLIYAVSSINTEPATDPNDDKPISLHAKMVDDKHSSSSDDSGSDDAITNTTDTTTSTNSNDSNESNETGEVVATPKTRDEMTSYWAEHSQSNLTKSLMLLMEDNPSFEEMERNEIMKYLPNYKGMDCIELGAGIGRFTNELAKGGCRSLYAIDFMEKFIVENEKLHKEKYPHIDMKFGCQDVCTLVCPDESYDFVFSNWLMMYLDDVEVHKLAEKMFRWCKKDGYIFFRESCEGGASGDKPRTNNPTHYRRHEEYSELFDNIADKVNKESESEESGEGKKYTLKRISLNKVQIYVDLKNKTNQYCWLYQKVSL